jgi:ribonucleoside-diphosphate reductase alpha chain
MTPNRERLPSEREGITHAFAIRTQDNERIKGYITVGFYEDGRIGEILVKMDQQGSKVSGFVDSWAVAVSLLLQHGVDLGDLCDKFANAQFEPSGMTENPRIRFARSPVDYIARWLRQRFVENGANTKEPEVDEDATQPIPDGISEKDVA